LAKVLLYAYSVHSVLYQKLENLLLVMPLRLSF